MVQSVEKYSRFLDGINDEDFLISPKEGIWSYSEVFSHVFQVNLASSIAVEKCIYGTGQINSDRIYWLAGLILLLGRFPPVKIKAPADIAAMVKKISKEEAKVLISKLNTRLQVIAPQIKNASFNQKVKHPRLGLLNAAQWFRFIEVHTLHHERQLTRITKMLRPATK